MVLMYTRLVPPAELTLMYVDTVYVSWKKERSLTLSCIKAYYALILELLHPGFNKFDIWWLPSISSSKDSLHHCYRFCLNQPHNTLYLFPYGSHFIDSVATALLQADFGTEHSTTNQNIKRAPIHQWKAKQSKLRVIMLGKPVVYLVLGDWKKHFI